MNTNNSINISQQNVKGNCDSKCSYGFSYSSSNSTATNNGIMINLTYDGSKNPPVSYNNKKYNVSTIMIICPSIHFYNNKNTNAEIIVEHTPVMGGNPLYVCVPIIKSLDSSTAGGILTEIITIVSTNAPKSGESTNLNLQNFSLKSIIPKKPFFTYANTDANSLPGDYIVFNISDAIPLSSDTLTTLGQIIQPYKIKTPGSALFYNPSGPNAITKSDDIYISCQPTGSSKEKTEVTYKQRSPAISFNFNYLFKKVFRSEIFKIIMGCAIFIIIFVLISILYNYLTKKDYSIKFPSFELPNFNVIPLGKPT